MNHRISSAVRAHLNTPGLWLPLGLALLACGGRPLSLGHNEDENVWDVCGDGNAGDYVADTQAEIDALAGCEVFDGNLTITVASEPLSLLPLSELHIVRDSLSITGVESLAGLEALEQVSGLGLNELLASDLTPLRNLRSVAGRAENDRLIDASLGIVGCNALLDLAGLENVSDWSVLTVWGGENLTSLSGLSAPPDVKDISISGTPQLADVSALAPIIEARFISIMDTALSDLGNLGLRAASGLSLSANPALTDLDGLSNLVSVQSLTLDDNDSLVSIVLRSLDDLALLAITGHAVLTTIPRYNATRGTGPYIAPGQPRSDDIPGARHAGYLVGDNALLDTVVLPYGFQVVDEVVIWGNPNLRRIDFRDLERSDELRITENPVLDRVTTPILQRVDDLVVVNNPALSMATFADVQTFTREVSGNLDDIAP